MTPSSFSWRYKKILIESGMNQGGSLYRIRHTFATLLLKEGANIENVKELLGHSKITTMIDIYRHVDLEDKKLTIIILEHAMKIGR